MPAKPAQRITEELRSICGLQESEITIAEVLKEGWHQSFPDNGGMAHVVSLGSSQIVEDVDFGNYKEFDNWVYIPFVINNDRR